MQAGFAVTYVLSLENMDGGDGRLHGVARVALVADSLVEGEICPELDAVSRVPVSQLMTN